MADIFTFTPRLGVNEIFDKAQGSDLVHQRLMKELIKLYQSNAKDFTIEFLQCLACCMVHMDKQPCYERSLEFAAKYCVYHENVLSDETFLLNIFQFIFSYHSCKSPAIRFRSCDFICKILSSKGQQAMIDDEYFVKIADSMLERLQDKVPSIRGQAVLALHRLQDPYAPKCPIIKAFMFHMEHDPSAEVRAKIVRNIAVTQQTLGAIFGRIYDVKISVRKEAILTLCRLKVQNLTIEWRQKILKMGYSEKEDVIKEYISRLILKWFKQCNQNFLDLLKMIDVETLETEVVLFVLFHLFRQYPITELLELVKQLQTKEKLIPFDKLVPNVATLWLAVLQYGGKCNEGNENNSDVDFISEIVPELTRFTKYIKTYSSYLSKGCTEKEFIMIQLIKIASTFSLSDEMGREQLKQIYRMLLTDDNVEIRLVPVIIKHLEEVVPSVSERSITLAEIISDIREPLQDCQNLTQENYAEENEDIEPQKINSECISDSEVLEHEREVQKDPETLIKCLTMVIEFMKGRDVTKIDGTLLSLKDHFIMACFKEENVQVVRLAQNALALMCIWNLKLAQDNFISFFIQIADDSACISAVESIFDLLLVHGFDAFQFRFTGRLDQDLPGCSTGTLKNFASDPSLTGPLLKYIVPMFVSLLYSNIPDMRATVSQGLAKLLLASHVNSPLVLAHLILIWFSPATDKEPLVRQPLGVFFSLFSRKRPGSGEIILNSVIPALTGLDEANEDEIYSEVNPVSVAKLMLSLIRHDVGQTPEEGGSYHYQLAVIICEEMQRITSSSLIYVLARTLLLLTFCPDDTKLAGNLLRPLKKMIKKMSRYWERKIIRIMEQFQNKIIILAERHLNQSPETDKQESSSLVREQDSDAVKVKVTAESTMEVDEEFARPISPEQNIPVKNKIIWNLPSSSKSKEDGHTENLVPEDVDSSSPNQSSDNDSTDEDEGQQKAGVISETSESNNSDEEDLALTAFVNTKSNLKEDNFARTRLTADKVLSPRVLRSGRKRKSK